MTRALVEIHGTMGAWWAKAHGTKVTLRQE